MVLDFILSAAELRSSAALPFYYTVDTYSAYKSEEIFKVDCFYTNNDVFYT